MNKSLSNIIIGVLILIILLQRCYSGKEIKVKESIVYDTTYIIKDTTIYKKVRLVKTDTIFKPFGIYIPSKNCDSLNIQYKSLLTEFLSRNIYQDTIYIDSIGKVLIKDTVQYNKLYGKRESKIFYKIPLITKTITIIVPNKRQLYVGAGIYTDDRINIAHVNTSLLYKTKTDHIYTIGINVNNSGIITYGGNVYWKIKLK